jgi:tetratricopeptide (TPR) repeat protein
MQNRPMPRLPVVLLAAVAAVASLAEAQAAPAPLTAPVRLPPAEDAWIRVDTAHFFIYSDASEDDTAGIARQLETFRGTLARLGSGLETRAAAPIVVYVFRDDAAYRPYRLRPDIAGFFVKDREGNSIAVGLDANSDPWQTVFHEYVHFFLNNNFIDIPLWFDEGMAEAYSTFRVKEGEGQLGAPLEHHRAWLRKHDLVPLDQLFAIDTGSRDYEEGTRQGTFYAESWALVHWLFWGGDDARTGTGFLGGLKRGGSIREALQPMLGDDRTELQQRLAAYLKAGRFAVSTFEVADLPKADQPARARRVPRAEILYRLGNYLLRLDPKTLEAAEAHLREAVRLDPKLGPAWGDLAQVEQQRGRFDEASRLFDRALALAPGDQGIALLYAFSLVDRTFPPGVVVRRPIGDVPGALVKARELFRRAMRQSPGNVEAWAGLGATYAFDAGDLKPGIEALEKAMALAPGRVEIAVDLASLYARSGQRDLARDLVDRVVSRSSDPDERAAGDAVLLRADIDAAQQKIQAGDIAGGVAMLRRLRGGAPAPDRATIDAMLEDTDQTTTRNQAAGKINRAAELSKQEDFKGAIRLLEEARAQASDKELQGEIDGMLSTVHRNETEARQVDLYNQAVRQFNARDYKGAATTLRRLLADKPGERLGGMAREMMDQIKSVAPGS